MKRGNSGSGSYKHIFLFPGWINKCKFAIRAVKRHKFIRLQLAQAFGYRAAFYFSNQKLKIVIILTGIGRIFPVDRTAHKTDIDTLSGDKFKFIAFEFQYEG